MLTANACGRGAWDRLRSGLMSGLRADCRQLSPKSVRRLNASVPDPKMIQIAATKP
jgi:hypothetical protein